MGSRQYEIIFLESETEILVSRIIVENPLAQVYQEGHQQVIMDEFEYHKFLGGTLLVEEETIENTSGNKSKFGTTCGCKICVRCMYGSNNWISIPIQ